MSRMNSLKKIHVIQLFQQFISILALLFHQLQYDLIYELFECFFRISARITFFIETLITIFARIWHYLWTRVWSRCLIQVLYYEPKLEKIIILADIVKNHMHANIVIKCSKWFTLLKSHWMKKNYINEKPYFCKYCDKSFNQKINFKNKHLTTQISSCKK